MYGDKPFLDTNILVYAYDVSSGTKHQKSSELLIKCWNAGTGVLSTQVLQEFFVTVTQKIPNPLDFDTAKNIISDLLKWEILTVNGECIVEGIEIQRKHRFSFWDSMIISAALKAGCDTILSEDLSHRQTISGIRIINPFRRQAI